MPNDSMAERLVCTAPIALVKGYRHAPELLQKPKVIPWEHISPRGELGGLVRRGGKSG